MRTLRTASEPRQGPKYSCPSAANSSVAKLSEDIATRRAGWHAPAVARRRRRGSMSLESLMSLTLMANAILLLATYRALAQPRPTGGGLAGALLWGVSLLGELWPLALLSVPLLAWAWRRLLVRPRPKPETPKLACIPRPSPRDRSAEPIPTAARGRLRRFSELAPRATVYTGGLVGARPPRSGVPPSSFCAFAEHWRVGLVTSEKDAVQRALRIANQGTSGPVSKLR